MVRFVGLELLAGFFCERAWLWALQRGMSTTTKLRLGEEINRRTANRVPNKNVLRDREPENAKDEKRGSKHDACAIRV